MKSKQIIYWIIGIIAIVALILVMITNQREKEPYATDTEAVKTDTVEMIETKAAQIAVESPAEVTTETDEPGAKETKTVTPELTTPPPDKTAVITKEVTETPKVAEKRSEPQPPTEGDIENKTKVVAAVVVEATKATEKEPAAKIPEPPVTNVEKPENDTIVNDTPVKEPPQKITEQPQVAEQPEETKAEESAVEKTEELLAQQINNWVVPDTERDKKNPVKADKESLSIGKALYKKHCKSCHGKKGLGDGPKAAQLDTPSGDFSMAAFQAQTDGTLRYKSIVGRDDMPSYEKKIPDEEDHWHIVNYLRTLQ